jgi:hypothetical protein
VALCVFGGMLFVVENELEDFSGLSPDCPSYSDFAPSPDTSGLGYFQPVHFTASL